MADYNPATRVVNNRRPHRPDARLRGRPGPGSRANPLKPGASILKVPPARGRIGIYGSPSRPLATAARQGATVPRQTAVAPALKVGDPNREAGRSSTRLGGCRPERPFGSSGAGRGARAALP